MANKAKDMYEKLKLSDMSYLLDPDAASRDSGSPASETILPIDDLMQFKDHPFKVDTEAPEFTELVDSIRENGLIYPVLVRPVDDKYEIISGHRRVAACREAGVTEVCAIVRPLDDYEATVIMVHSNLHRPEISIGERARAYRMCMDAEKHQGKKGMDTAASIGEDVSDSRRTVYRYIRLSYLIDGLLNKVDEKKLTINIGVELSYLDEDSQEALFKYMDEYGIAPDNEKAVMLHKAWDEAGTLTFEEITAILLKQEKKAPTSISFKRKELQEYFDPDKDMEYMSNVIHVLLRKYKEGALDEFLTEVER